MDIIEYSDIILRSNGDDIYPIFIVGGLSGFDNFHRYSIDVLYFIVGDEFFDYHMYIGKIMAENKGRLEYVG